MTLLDASSGAVGTAFPAARRVPRAAPRPSPAPGAAAGAPVPVAVADTADPPGYECPAIGQASVDGAMRYIPCDNQRRIALTVDDGPDPRYTPQVLSLLGRLGITATFCMIGESAAAQPGLVREVASAGHHIANHTWDHRDVAGIGQSAMRDQLGRTSEAITSAGAPEPSLFRAPFGSWSGRLVATCTGMGMRPLDWSVDPSDWARPGTGRIVDVIMRTTVPGSIILEHDGGGDRSQTVAALAIVLPRLLDEGYVFVTP